MSNASSEKKLLAEGMSPVMLQYWWLPNQFYHPSLTQFCTLDIPHVPQAKQVTSKLSEKILSQLASRYSWNTEKLVHTESAKKTQYYLKSDHNCSNEMLS